MLQRDSPAQVSEAAAHCKTLSALILTLCWKCGCVLQGACLLKMVMPSTWPSWELRSGGTISQMLHSIKDPCCCKQMAKQRRCRSCCISCGCPMLAHTLTWMLTACQAEGFSPAAHQGFSSRAQNVRIENLYRHACQQGKALVLCGEP